MTGQIETPTNQYADAINGWVAHLDSTCDEVTRSKFQYNTVEITVITSRTAVRIGSVDAFGLPTQYWTRVAIASDGWITMDNQLITRAWIRRCYDRRNERPSIYPTFYTPNH